MNRLGQVIAKAESRILSEWLTHQQSAEGVRSNLIMRSEVHEQSRQFLQALSRALSGEAAETMEGESWDEVRGILADISRSRALKGLSPSETASFVFSLKHPLFAELRQELSADAKALAEATWHATLTLDGLVCTTIDVYQKSREDVILRQQHELMELSTPVVELWDGVLALPLIGTLDSARTQVVMESLLERIVETGASIAIIDITGVPTVDTLVAQHLLKTVAAARLMGADCIISGIRPQIAQTIVHLGVDLGEVTTKATLGDAFAVALARTGFVVSRPSAKG